MNKPKLKELLNDIAATAEDPICDERGEGVAFAFNSILRLAEQALYELDQPDADESALARGMLFMTAEDKNWYGEE
jgi:hypothetical protein